MKGFQKFYLWGMHVKFYLGLYFAALVVLSGALTALYGGDSLRLTTLLQMLVVCLVVSLLQDRMLPPELTLSRLFFGRSIFFLAVSSLLVALTALLGEWFPGLPDWCPWAMGVLMFIGCNGLLVGMKLEQDADTLRLNRSLQSYQKTNRE